jgi:hypothetical protein
LIFESNVPRVILWICAAWAAVVCSAPPFTATQEITGNDIYSLCGHGDTLWMVTKLGANFTFATSDSLIWQGYKTDSLNGAIGFGDGAALLCMRAGIQNITAEKAVYANRLWLHKHSSGTDKVIDPGFTKADSLSAISASADFSAIDVAWSRGSFWSACLDGGLLRITGSGDSALAIFPGSKKWFQPSLFTNGAFSGISKASFPDTLQRVVSVKVQDTSAASTLLWVATPEKLRKFIPRDTAWDSVTSSLSDSKLSFKHYRQVYVAPDRDSLRLFAAMTIRNQGAQSDTIGFFAFDNNKNAWTMVLNNLDSPPAVTFGQNGELYVVWGNQIHLYKDTTMTIALRINGDVFQKRMTLAGAGAYPDHINDILFLNHPGADASFWIASSTNSLPTSNGLFFSRGEKADEADTAAFHYVHRDKKITPGLRESYAFPGILNSAGPGKAVFAYNLSRSSKVTIRIFDWNMDLVKTIIKDRDRPAGNDRANGRSADAAEDSWDGTNTYGKRVAVGVYYYKITAQSGEHSFGKIIVAK